VRRGCLGLSTSHHWYSSYCKLSLVSPNKETRLTVNSANALLIIATLLNQCDTLDNPYDYYKLLIPITIFENLAHFLLLVVVVYGVNSLLRQHHGHNPSYFNFIYGFILVVVGGLCAGLIGISCWNDSVYASAYYNGTHLYAEVYVRLTYFVLYLLAVIAASIMAAATIFSMRARGAINRVSSPTYLAPSSVPLTRHQNLITWTVAIMFSMLFSAILYVAESAVYFTDGYFSIGTSQAFNWLEAIFSAFAWICLLVIAKSNVLDMSMHNSLPQVYNAQNPAYDPVPVPQQQQLPYTVHNGAPPPLQQQQPYYYQQQPEIVGVSNGNAHTMHVK
jgi:hypothetical protein